MVDIWSAHHFYFEILFLHGEVQYLKKRSGCSAPVVLLTEELNAAIAKTFLREIFFREQNERLSFLASAQGQLNKGKAYWGPEFEIRPYFDWRHRDWISEMYRVGKISKFFLCLYTIRALGFRRRGSRVRVRGFWVCVCLFGGKKKNNVFIQLFSQFVASKLGLQKM